MRKFNVTFEQPSISQHLKDWVDACKSTEQQPYSFPTVDEVPEDIAPIIAKIRSELEALGIDPSTVYPCDVESENSDEKGFIRTTLVFNYENYETKKND